MKVRVAQLNEAAEAMSEVARTAVMPCFKKGQPGGIQAKGRYDVVTDVDLEAESLLGQKLASIFPTAFILGEESADSLDDWGQSLRSADQAVVIDPLDGTQNFVAGLPLFGIIVAIVIKGEIAAGIIHDPVVGDWAMALRGEGAWTRESSGRSHDLRVAPGKLVAEMKGSISWHWLDEPRRAEMTGKLHSFSGSFSLRCPAHEYRLLAGGHLDFLFYNKLFPWDQAAGLLLHKEAGGYSALLTGESYNVSEISYELLAAPDKTSWHSIATVLRTSES